MTAPRAASTDAARKQDASSIVLLIGCDDAAPALERAGLLPRTHPRLERGLGDVHHRNARAVVFGPEALPDGGRLPELIRASRKSAPFTEVFVWAPEAAGDIVREALKAGAEDVILGDDPEVLTEVVRKVVEKQRLLPKLQRLERGRNRGASRFEGLVSRSPKMWEVFETCLRIAPTEATVLILGETGTGKELLARAIHKNSKRKGRFVPLNCGAVPETLIDSELFGHEKGSFTGAHGSKQGLFRHADGGTLFLDEIGNIPLSAQFSLLRALQEGSVRPVGGSEEIEVDVRVIAATSTPLDDAVRDGKFREDLLYRLDVIRLVVPPLRDRPEDVLYLFGYFRNKFSKHYNVDPPEFSDGFVEAMLEYDWPGNVRELENFTERLMLTHRSSRLTGRHFARLTRSYSDRAGAERRRAAAEEPAESGRLPRVAEPPPEPHAAVDLTRTLEECLEPLVSDVERAYLEAALAQNKGRIQATADTAGLSRRTLLRKLKHYDIDKRTFKK